MTAAETGAQTSTSKNPAQTTSDEQGATRDRGSVRLSADERAAMKERAAEVRAAGRRATSVDKAAAEAQDCLDKIAAMRDDDRELAERIHALVLAAAPELAPKTWYGMPAYAKDGKLVCFFQPAGKFKARYSTFGFEPNAHLDDGDMWPTSYAVTSVGEAEEKLITELVTRAVS